MNVCTECVLKALFLLIFGAESEDSQWRMREVMSSNRKDYLLRRNGNLSIVNKQFYSKEILGLNNQLLQLKEPTNSNFG